MPLARDASSYAATIVRGARGIFARTTRDRRKGPERLLELFDFEACPYCRKVREALTELDLDYLARPVARGSRRRELLRELGGKVQVPYLVDPNTGTRMYESDDIVSYLNEHYARDGKAGWPVPLPSFLDDLNSFAASAVTLGRGRVCRVVRESGPPKLLELFNMEGSPYCRKVREVLSELDLEYVVRNVPKGSPQRKELERLGGKVQVPFLVDPNTGVRMYESDDIVTYLEREYGNEKRRARPSGRASQAR
ncbi:MAG: glutathione S-transferase [Candidatus Binatia bacterium]|nr:MAG: glutathione S-transferase [Candidatus Binatia bacterium]